MRHTNRPLLLLIAVFCSGVAGCASTQWQTEDADAQLDAVLMEWQQAVANGGCRRQQAASPGVIDCDGIGIELRRLAAAFPNRPRILFANGLIAWEEGYNSRAIAWLDALLAREPAHVEGAVLRGRIALEEGNIPFAKRLAQETLALVPDSALLHELLASVAYLEDEYEAAVSELRLALALGAPRWRVNYHLGLIAEARGDLPRASNLYGEALKEQTGFERARARRSAIQAGVAASAGPQ